MANEQKSLSLDDFQFLMNALIDRDLDEKGEKQLQRLYKRSASIKDVVVIADTMTEIVSSNIISTLTSTLSQLAELIQVQDKLLEKVGITNEDRKAAYDEVQALVQQQLEEQRANMQNQQEQAAEEAKEPTTEDTEDGLKVVAVENTVDLSIDKE